MAFPPVPFNANLKPGAQAFSPNGSIPWGDVPEFIEKVEVVGFLGDKASVGAPLWSNGRIWTVPVIYITPVTAPTDPGGTTLPVPDRVTFKWLDAQGNVVITQNYVIEQ
jgi:hypothetical protein